MADRLSASLRIEVLRGDHDRAGFSCGVPDLDVYLRERAGQDTKRHLAVAFVLLEGGPIVLGYYTLSQRVISLADVPQKTAQKLPRYPLLPATLIGRLAVDERHQGEGLGRLLLGDALRRSWRAAHTVASYAVRVDATDDGVRDFYVSHGFVPLPKERLRLFLPMADLDHLFSGEG